MIYYNGFFSFIDRRRRAVIEPFIKAFTIAASSIVVAFTVATSIVAASCRDLAPSWAEPASLVAS